ncbi:exopolysaccharide biosynthesis polyprenyl glycosylphosphotransferase [Phormidesmis priestleyi]
MSISTSSCESSAKLLISRRQLAIALLAGDILGLGVALSSALWLRFGHISELHPLFYAIGLFVLTGLYLVDAYRPELQIQGVWVSLRIVISNLTIALVSSAFIYLSGMWAHSLLGRGVLLPGLGLFTGWAICSRWIAIAWFQSQSQSDRWLVLGTEEQTQRFVQDFSKLNPFGELVFTESSDLKILDSLNRSKEFSDLFEIPARGRLTQRSQFWSGIIISNRNKLIDSQIRRLMHLRLKGTSIYGLLEFYEAFFYKLPTQLLNDSWFVSSSGYRLISDRVTLKIKRLIDIVSTTVLLIVFSPMMLLTMLAIRLDSPGAVLYSQVRSGLNRKPFKVYKFRSMYQDAEIRGAQWAQERDPRITRVGHWLRLLRIDELPQIWNVLRGEMSLIGPRPERPEFDTKLAAEIPYYDVRYWVKPGITGWAQVMYPYGASVEDAYQKLAYDLYYIKNYSLWLEWAIAVKTIRVVLLGKGR